jgi:hypothetical protein
MSIIPSAQVSMVEDEIESKILDIRDYYNNILGIFLDIICRILLVLIINIEHIISLIENMFYDIFWMPIIYIILSLPFEILNYFLYLIYDFIDCLIVVRIFG